MKINIPDNLINSINEFLNTNNLGNRSYGNGNKRNQLVGLIGEFITYNYFFNCYPDFKTGFDGGIDFIYKNKKIDVKTMERKGFVKPDYVNNFYHCQKDYNSDTLIFCNYNNIQNVIEICGWIPKIELDTKAIYYQKDTIRTRFDGSEFKLNQSIYEIKMKDLYNIKTLF